MKLLTEHKETTEEAFAKYCERIKLTQEGKLKPRPEINFVSKWTIDFYKKHYPELYKKLSIGVDNG